MLVRKLVQNVWEHPHCRDITKNCPTWEDVLSALNTLDADKHSLVAFEGWGKAEMLIGGGRGNYIISIATSPDDLFTLINSQEEASERVLVKTGGQTGNYPANEVVGYDKAIQSVQWFCEHNEPDPHLIWKAN